MNTLAAKLQSGFEPIPGYFLRDRLGSGGYGEVWSADAPGGLKKAIKFVYGNIEGDRASSELKSLQRIRQVNHPFILSLERIEIIEGQLIIVSELAQCSLHDRYAEFRKKQIVGIPRDRLLTYLADAADGLDFLCQKHDLQHLDVKPGNLLLLSDRIKVADFGLVKDLQSATQSMLAGMTPTYAAPEMFDGRPGRFSDQYSLAILYQEMLTGELPFRGRTTAQLANEHLNRAPDLNSLPASDRAVVAKALAKRPQQRYSDCRELINALIEAPRHEQSKGDDLVQVRGWSPNTGSTSKVPKQSAHRRTSTARRISMDMRSPSQAGLHAMASRNAEQTRKPESRVELSELVREQGHGAQGASKSVDLIIGIGGKGNEVLSYLHSLDTKTTSKDKSYAFLAIDTDHSALESLVDRSRETYLDYGSIIHIPIKSPHYYRSETEPFAQLSRRWVYNIPRSQLTDGVRPLGMLALLDHARFCQDKIVAKIEDIFEAAMNDKTSVKKLRIQIVASASGGTGSAIASEVGFMARHIAESLDFPVEISLTLMCASPNPLANADLSSASAIGCLLEINHYFRTNGLHPALPGLDENVASKPPFDRVCLLYCGQAGRREDGFHSVREAALTLMHGVDLLIQQSNLEASASEEDCYPWLSTVSTNVFDMSYILDPRRANLTLVLDIILNWVQRLDHYVEVNKSPVPVAQLSTKMGEKIEYLVNDLLRESGWNAQAWVRSCMATASSINEQSEKPIADPSLDRFGIGLIEEINTICNSLGIDPHRTNTAFASMLHEGLSNLHIHLCDKWLTHPQQWGLIPSLLEYLAAKLKIQINSLFTVAQKLANQHDSIIEQAETQDTDLTEEADRLSRLFIESQFHALAGKLLGCIVDSLTGYRTKWCDFSTSFARELLGFVNRLCEQDLGIPLESYMKDKPASRVDRHAKTANTWLNSLLVDRWNRFSKLGSWHPSSDRWPQGLENDSSASTSDLLTMVIDLLESELKSDGPKQEDPKTEPELHSAILQDLALEDLTSTTPHYSEILDLAKGTDREVAVIEELYKRLREASPYFVEFGGKSRQILQLPAYMWHQIPLATRDAIRNKCEIQHVEHLTEPILISIGTNLDLENLLERLFLPTTETWNLVPRILSRVDIDWIPFTSSD
ncbi:protein kinase domain-containing protein [Pirellulaceae bacterium SH449]